MSDDSTDRVGELFHLKKQLQRNLRAAVLLHPRDSRPVRSVRSRLNEVNEEMRGLLDQQNDGFKR